MNFEGTYVAMVTPFTQDEEIDDHDSLTDRQLRFAIGDDGYDLCSVDRPAVTDDHTNTETDDDTAEYRCQENIVRDVRRCVEILDGECQYYDGIECRDGKGLTDLLVTEI